MPDVNPVPALPPLPVLPISDPMPTFISTSEHSEGPTPTAKKSFPFIWISLIVVAITLASSGTYYVLRSRTQTSTSAGPITEVPTNSFAQTTNPFNETTTNPFSEDTIPENPFAPETDTTEELYQNPFEELR